MSPVFTDVLRPLDAPLAVSVELDDTTLLIRGPYDLRRGDFVKVGDELMRVKAVRAADGRDHRVVYLAAEVLRGFAGSIPTTHRAGTTVQIIGHVQMSGPSRRATPVAGI